MRVKFRHITLVLITLLSSVLVNAQSADLSVVANDNGAPAELTSKSMRSILKGQKQRWNNGSKVVIALMKTTTSTGGSTASKVYDMNNQELNKYWLAQVFQGRSKAPSFFTSEEALKDFVAQTPGAIGILSAAKSSGGRVIKIDGQGSF